MRKALLTIAILALPLLFVGIDAHTQDTDQFWVTFSTNFHAPPEYFTLSVFGNGGDADQFNFGGLSLISDRDGFEATEEFSNEFVKIGNTSDACVDGLQVTGSAFFETLDIRVGPRWEGNVVMGENRSICLDLIVDNEFAAGDHLLFEVRYRATSNGSIFFFSPPDSVTVSNAGTAYDPITVLRHKLEVQPNP